MQVETEVPENSKEVKVVLIKIWVKDIPEPMRYCVDYEFEFNFEWDRVHGQRITGVTNFNTYSYNGREVSRFLSWPSVLSIETESLPFMVKVTSGDQVAVDI